MESELLNNALAFTVKYFHVCRPGHGAPTGDIRKKKFTEYQLDRSQSSYNLDQVDQYVGGGGGGVARWGSEMDISRGEVAEDAMMFGR